MKKIICLALAAITMMGSMVTTFAGSIPKVTVNGQKVYFRSVPFMLLGKTNVSLNEMEKLLQVKISTPSDRTADVSYIPIREIANQIGATVSYDKDTNTVNMEYAYPEGTKVDEHGRKIRTTNLPKNADCFPYVLESLPNAMYETPFRWEKITWTIAPVEGKDYIKPVNISQHNWGTKENIDKWVKVVEDNLELRLNVDYKTVDDAWREKLIKTYMGTYFEGKPAEIYYDEQKAHIDKYIKYMKDNKISVMGDYYIEPSMTYYTNGYYLRAWVKFSVKSDTAKEVALYEIGGNKLEANKWYEGYIDLSVGTNVMNSDGSDSKIYSDYITLGNLTGSIGGGFY